MPTALYYPHTRFENERLLKTCLVLFDRVQWIAPDKHFPPQYKNKSCAEAMEIIGERYVPNDEEKNMVHEEVERLVSNPLPDWFVFKPENSEIGYQILPEKFGPKTWQLLSKANFVTVADEPAPEYKSGKVFDMVTSPALGLALMGILADVCRGTRKHSITDEQDGYVALTRYFMENGGFEPVQLDEKIPAPETYERLINLSYKTINCDGIPFRRLLSLRKREEVKGDQLLKNARDTYFNKLDSYARQLTTEIKYPADRVELERDFCKEMERELAGLKSELKMEAEQALLSKEMIGVGLAMAGAVIEPFSGTAATAILLTKKLRDYRKKRLDKIKANPTGWLYMHNRFPIF